MSQYICDHCGGTFERNPSSLTGGNKFCSSECYGQFKSENLDPEDLPWYKGAKKMVTCDHCGDEFEAFRTDREQEHTFCSHDCYGEWEQTDSDRPYYGPKWEKQRRKALEELEEVCCYEGCDRTESRSGRDLDLHHIVPVREFDSFEEANKPENLVPVCAEHHAKIEGKPKGELLNEP